MENAENEMRWLPLENIILHMPGDGFDKAMDITAALIIPLNPFGSTDRGIRQPRRSAHLASFNFVNKKKVSMSSSPVFQSMIHRQQRGKLIGDYNESHPSIGTERCYENIGVKSIMDVY